MNVGLDIKEGKTQDIQQKREMQEQVYEALERDMRRLNLVIMGNKEDSEEDGTKTLMELMKVLGLEDEGVVQVLGRIGKAGGKPRPIRVKLGNWESRRRVLLKAKMLKDTIGFKSIYVCPNLTLHQQEEDKKLRDKVKDFRGKRGHERVKII